MPLTELLNTAAAGTSAEFACAGPTSIVAAGLASGEIVTVLIQGGDAAFYPLAIKGHGIVTLSPTNILVVVNAPGAALKVSKLLTGGVVNVGYGS